LPLASLLILVGGILRLKIYYSVFDVDITKYIELSEVVLDFFSDIVEYILVVIISSPLFIIFLNIKFPSEIGWLRFILFCMLGILVCYFTILGYRKISHYEINDPIMNGLMVLALAYAFINRNTQKLGIKTLILLFFIGGFIITSCITPLIRANELKRDFKKEYWLQLSKTTQRLFFLIQMNILLAKQKIIFLSSMIQLIL